jgi:hypothetical protein
VLEAREGLGSIPSTTLLNLGDVELKEAVQPLDKLLPDMPS